VANPEDPDATDHGPSGRYPARARRRRRTHERILEVAADLLYKEGIGNVSVDDIAGAVGVTKATLYQHFRSKDELIAACLSAVDQLHFDWFVNETNKKVAGGSQPLVAVFDVLDMWFHSAVFRGCAFINATVQLADGTHPAHLAVLTHKRRTRDWLQQLARDAGVADERSERLAAYLMVAMEGAIITALVQQDPDAGKDARHIAELLVAEATQDPSFEHRCERIGPAVSSAG
jgi:AcrR family transcriptional regulator